MITTSHIHRGNGPDLPLVYLVRHGETAWTLTGQHTGRTDLPLTEQGERQARALGPTLTALRIDRIFSSPLHRAQRTAELAMPHSRAGVPVNVGIDAVRDSSERQRSTSRATGWSAASLRPLDEKVEGSS